MSKNESRRERLDQESQEENQKSGINKAYYWIIGILFLVLILLLVFIFSRSGDDVNLGEEDEQSNLVEEETGIESPEEPEQDTTEEETATETEESAQEETEEIEPAEEETEEADGTDETGETNVEEDADTDTEEENQTAVNDEAPHDPSHVTDYSGGSADRIEIKNRVMEATGLGDDLIEDWVGNNGPGRVVATVSSLDRSESYEVYLQYGDGRWHVTSVE